MTVASLRLGPVIKDTKVSVDHGHFLGEQTRLFLLTTLPSLPYFCRFSLSGGEVNQSNLASENSLRNFVAEISCASANFNFWTDECAT